MSLSFGVDFCSTEKVFWRLGLGIEAVWSVRFPKKNLCDYDTWNLILPTPFLGLPRPKKYDRTTGELYERSNDDYGS
jgi:hypothetical protein